MASDFKRVRYLRPRYSQKSYQMLMKMLQDSLSLEVSDVVAQFRYHVIKHYYKYGIRATLEAFNLKKSSFHEWKRTYEKSGKKVSSLIPHQTRPLHVRKMETDWRLVGLIK